MIEGLSHMTFIVRDLDRMSAILEGVFDAREVYASDAEQFSLSREKFFLIGDIWIAFMEGEALPERSYNHIAFKIDDADFDRYAERRQAWPRHAPAAAAHRGRRPLDLFLRRRQPHVRTAQRHAHRAAGALCQGIGGGAMNSVPAAPMATIAGMAAMPSVVAAAATNILAARAFHRCRENHSSKDKRNHAEKRQQQNSEMHPSSRVHLNSPPVSASWKPIQ